MKTPRKNTPVGKQERHLREKYAPKLYSALIPADTYFHVTTTARTKEQAEKKFRSGEFEVNDKEGHTEIDWVRVSDPDWDIDVEIVGGEQ